jgi:hypothetical protein
MTTYYTNELRGDGFGANYQTLVCAILYAEVYCGGEFIYSKPNLKNTYENEADEYEDIMNLSSCFKSIDDIEDKNAVNIIDIPHSYSVILRSNNLDMYLNSVTMKKIRFQFKQNKLVNIFDDGHNHVAIHIRRPSLHKNIDNLSEHCEGWDKTKMTIDELVKYTTRFTSDSYFINIINNIRQTCTYKKNIFHIISEGKHDDFKKFEGDDLIFHLNEPVKDSYIYMVMSNTLIISQSAFGYVAALLNENLKLNMHIYQG